MDSNHQEKIGNGQPDNSYWGDIKKAALKSARVKGGILKIADAGENGERWRTIQDAHNANHVLTHLSFMMFRIFIGKNSKNTGECQARIIAHLSCLQEFIQPGEIELVKAVYKILRDIKIRPLESLEDWARFILNHWTDIRILAGRYSDPERCFTKADYQKLKTVIEDTEI